MKSDISVRAGLGLLIILAGFLALLGGLRVLAVDWHFFSPLFIIALGVWITLCATECHQIQSA